MLNFHTSNSYNELSYQTVSGSQYINNQIDKEDSFLRIQEKT